MRGDQPDPADRVDKFTVPQLREALTALGVDLGSSQAPKLRDLPYLVGCLLALAEAAVSLEGVEAESDADDDPEARTTDGYVQTVLGVAGGKLPAAARLWSALMEERLWRTLVHLSLNQISDEGGQLYAEVMTAGLLVSSNLAQGTNRPLTHHDVRDGINAARFNARVLAERLDALVAFERARGVDIPEAIQDLDTLMGPPTD